MWVNEYKKKIQPTFLFNIEHTIQLKNIIIIHLQHTYNQQATNHMLDGEMIKIVNNFIFFLFSYVYVDCWFIPYIAYRISIVFIIIISTISIKSNFREFIYMFLFSSFSSYSWNFLSQCLSCCLSITFRVH